MTVKERIVREIDGLNDDELARVIEYLAFLKFHSRLQELPPLDDSRLASLYADAAEEDRSLAEEGMTDYADGLTREDAR